VISVLSVVRFCFS